jgi:FemAB-related protein (PEP-CTERM system-associated)
MGATDQGPTASAVVVSPYAGDHAAWDAFVRHTDGGTLFHLIGWKEVLERTFGFTAHYLVARRGTETVGVLPLFELRAPGMARGLLSLPFAVEGGVCSTDAAAQAALDAAALARGAARGARWVELRDGRSGVGFRVQEGRYWRFRRPLHGDEVADLAATPAKRRNMIRHGIRHGLQARVDADDLPVFHDLYARTARRFGTPVFPLRYFRSLLERFPDETALMTVRLGRTPVAGALVFFFGATVCPYYVGSRRDFFRYAVNDFLYWELMRYGGARGARVFDFGRSKLDTGAFRFKRLWGFDPEPLRYRVAMLAGSALAERANSDAGAAWLRTAWRFLPLPVTKLLGPFFVSRYGPYFT